LRTMSKCSGSSIGLKKGSAALKMNTRRPAMRQQARVSKG
jgi:hypothetical protein